MGKILLVISGKGGTGKTSVAAGVSCALAVGGKKVLAIDADAGMRNLDISLGMTGDAVFSFADVALGRTTLNEGAAQNRSVPRLYMLTAPFEDAYAEMKSSHIRRMLHNAGRDFDWTIIDCPAGMGQAARLFLPFCSRAMLVITLETAAIRCAEGVANELFDGGLEQVGLVVNRVRRELYRRSKGAIDEAIDYTGVPLLGIVPEDIGISQASANGNAIFSACGVKSYNAFRNIALRLNGKEALLQRP